MHCTRSRAMEDQPMMTIERGPRRDIVPNGEVCAAITSGPLSLAGPQTRSLPANIGETLCPPEISVQGGEMKY